MTEIELMRDFPISLDGLRVEIWPRGSQRAVSDEILAILIGEGACRIVENKAHVAAPENKEVDVVKGGGVNKGGRNTSFQFSERPALPNPTKRGRKGKK